MKILRRHSDGQYSVQGQVVALTELLAEFIQQPIAVLLPGQDVLFHQVTLGKTRRADLAKAIPFALEEQLAMPVDQCHFAIYDTDVAGQYDVLVIRKDLLECCLQELSAVNIIPSSITPDYLALPLDDHPCVIQRVIQSDADMACVRIAQHGGFSVEVEHLDAVLSSKLMPELKSHLFHYEDLDENKGKNKSEYVDEDAVQKYNILQGMYRPKQTFSGLKRRWFVVGILTAALVMMMLGVRSAEYVVYRHQLTQLNQRVLKTYQSIFPHSQSVLEPRFRLSTILHHLQKAKQQQQFFPLLVVVGKTLHSFPTVVLTRVRYQQQRLVMSVQAPKLTVLDRLTREFRHAGLTVQQTGYSSDRQRVQVQLTLSRQA